MLIPLRHENMEGRRWPVITFALIALNILIFLGTHWQIEAQEPERVEARTHLLLLAAMHPELKMPEDAARFVEAVKSTAPEAAWNQLSANNRQLVDAWDARIRLMDDSGQLQAEMDSLALRFESVQKSSIIENYAFVPAHPRAIAFLTCMFLHAGWLHLIGNMWFLWLAGFILEDRWGRIIYPTFYILAGIAATLFHAMFYPTSWAPTLGASGAIAALMGAFLVRFPKLKIEMLWFMLLFRLRFKVEAYWLLPMWLLMEIFGGTLSGQASGVAHWAHVGGFIFGALGALVIARTGLEQKANAVIEDKIGWTADPAVVQGTELLEKGKLDEGISVLEKYVAAKPDAADGFALLRQLHWRKGDMQAYRDATAKLCQLHLKAQDADAAWQDFEEYTNGGGDRMPAGTWLELCRIAESRQDYHRAATEYEALATAHPTERQSILALLAAGRLTLKQLGRPADALRCYRAAEASKVPHLDWESNIQAGIKAAEQAAGATHPASVES
ncbi:MAG TPA: rhomboid family intramembrane serine protease [Candidatus Acidoferrum sp.]|nr:rhomboid family intramembrane serine protease [Candidatus Acidoferrum sp.]